MSKVPQSLRDLLKPKTAPEKGPRSFNIDLDVYKEFSAKVRKREHRVLSDVVEALMRYYLTLPDDPLPGVAEPPRGGRKRASK